MAAGGTFNLAGSRIANATRTWQAAEDVDVVDWLKEDAFIVAGAVENTGKDAASASLRLEWRNVTEEGSFIALDGSGELTWSADTDLVNNNVVDTGEKGCTSTASVWQYGVEREGANPTGTTLAIDVWTEHHWAINCADAGGAKEYEFRIWNVTMGVEVGILLATLTIEDLGPIQGKLFSTPMSKGKLSSTPKSEGKLAIALHLKAKFSSH